MVSLKRSAVFASTCLLLAGCSTLGTNVKGSFACQAPNGICAPTMQIDDSALAQMNRTPAASGSAAPAMLADAAAHSPGALKIVLPARTDRFGRWRDQTVVYVEPAHNETPVPAVSGGSAARRLTLSELAAGAPDMAAIGGAPTARVSSATGTATPVTTPAAAGASPPTPYIDPAPVVGVELQGKPGASAPSFPAGSAGENK